MILVTEFGDFYDNEVTGETSHQVFEKWREEYCLQKEGIWRRKTDEELKQIDICLEPTELQVLQEQVTKLIINQL